MNTLILLHSSDEGAIDVTSAEADTGCRQEQYCGLHGLRHELGLPNNGKKPGFCCCYCFVSLFFFLKFNDTVENRMNPMKLKVRGDLGKI